MIIHRGKPNNACRERNGVWNVLVVDLQFLALIRFHLSRSVVDDLCHCIGHLDKTFLHHCLLGLHYLSKKTNINVLLTITVRGKQYSYIITEDTKERRHNTSTKENIEGTENFVLDRDIA